MKAPLILVVSERMDNNQKQDRNEDSLIRMGKKARAHLGLAGEKVVEIWPDSAEVNDRINRSRALEIFQAYSEDLKKLKKTNMDPADYERVGFVTSKTFDFICKDRRKKRDSNIWIADTIEDTVVGGDPEFILARGDGTFQYAASVNGFGHDDELGSDGPLAEIRPTPSTTVKGFVDNIRSLLRDHPNAQLIDPYDWISGCYFRNRRADGEDRNWAVGGHIHLGTPNPLAKKIERHYNSDRDNSYRNAVYACLKKILDEYVAIPMIKIDGVSNTKKRREQYGTYGDVRMDHGRLEYRSLSGMWLAHPELALMVIGAAKAVSHAYFRLLSESDYEASTIMTESARRNRVTADVFSLFDSTYSHWNRIPIMQEMKATRTSGQMRDILHDAKINLDKRYHNSLKKMFRALSTYREYSEIIDKFLEVVKLPAKELNKIDTHLKHTWVGNAEFII